LRQQQLRQQQRRQQWRRRHTSAAQMGGGRSMLLGAEKTGMESRKTAAGLTGGICHGEKIK